MTPTSTVGTSTQGLAPWASDYVTSTLGGATAVANEPYQAYSGALTSGPSALQDKMFQGLGGLSLPQNYGASFSSSTAPQMPGITGTGLNTNAPTSSGTTGVGAGTSGTPASGGIASSYMNPYLDAVLNPQMQALRENAQSNMNAQMGKLTSQGAFGGGRQAVMQSAGNRDLLQELNKTLGLGYATAYDKGLAQFNREQDQGKDIYNLLGSAGATQRGIEQEGITADMKEFERQRDYPKEQIKFLRDMIGPGTLPITSTENEPAQLSALASLIGAAGGISELSGILDNTDISGLLNRLGFGE
jgi:hypothetical protein